MERAIPLTTAALKRGAAFILDATLDDLHFDGLKRVDGPSKLGVFHYVPMLFHGQNKVGKIDDVLIDKSGKITVLMVGVGGFLGMDEKDVALPFSAVKSEKKNDKWWLTVDQTKDSLKNAAGFKYNSSTTTWSPENK